MTLALFATGAMLRAAELDDGEFIGSGHQNPIPLEDGTENVSYDSNASPEGYYWGDRLGDNSDEAVNPPGLSMGAFNLRAGNWENDIDEGDMIRLDLNGGDITATSGSIIGSDGGDSDAASVVIQNVGDISMGDGTINNLTTHEWWNNNYPGDIKIGTSVSPAGNIQVADIIGGCKGDSYPDPACAINIYSTGNVMITNSAGELGQLTLGIGWSESADDTISVYHRGNFKTGLAGIDIFRDSGNNETVRIITFDGWFGGTGDPTGAFYATQIVSRAENESTSHTREIHAADVSIVNYAEVQVTGNIETYTASPDGWNNEGDAGDITVTNIVDDIIIGGTLDAHSDNDSGTLGIVELEAGDSITIGSLDLDNVQYAMLRPGGDAFIEGALDNFDTASPSGGGTKGSPYDTDEGGLRAPADTVVYYEYVEGGLNDSLGGHVWQLENLSGTGNGGLLMVQQQSGTVIMIK